MVVQSIVLRKVVTLYPFQKFWRKKVANGVPSRIEHERVWRCIIYNFLSAFRQNGLVDLVLVPKSNQDTRDIFLSKRIRDTRERFLKSGNGLEACYRVIVISSHFNNQIKYLAADSSCAADSFADWHNTSGVNGASINKQH